MSYYNPNPTANMISPLVRTLYFTIRKLNFLFLCQQTNPLNVTFHLCNASNDAKHRLYSFQGQPSRIWYMRILDNNINWGMHFGTVMTIKTTQWVSRGGLLQLFVRDCDNKPFTQACSTHRKRSGCDQAFVFRCPEFSEHTYDVGVRVIYLLQLQYKLFIFRSMVTVIYPL